MKSDIRLTDMPEMTVSEMVEELSDAYSSLIDNGMGVKMMPSVMLWGPPGVGKSQGIREIAQRIEGRTGKNCHITDVRLLLFNPIDLRGIPTANEDKTLAVWLRPQIFRMDESEDVVNILFLDEISAAPQSVQAAAYQITLDRVVGEHRLPDNCIVVAAGNRVTDKSVAYKMPKALANRLLHIEIVENFASWHRWAVESGIDEKIVGYLSYKRDALMCFDASSEALAFATPRSWEMVSNLLKGVNSDAEKIFSLICGLVGVAAASEFLAWTEVYSSLPSIEDIFAGKLPKPPKGSDSMYALISAMTAYAREHADDTAAIGNSIAYACKLPPDYTVVLIRDYLCLREGYRNTLMNIPEFARWMQRYASLLNGIV